MGPGKDGNVTRGIESEAWTGSAGSTSTTCKATTKCLRRSEILVGAFNSIELTADGHEVGRVRRLRMAFISPTRAS